MVASTDVRANSELPLSFWVGFVLTGVLNTFWSFFSRGVVQSIFDHDSLFLYWQFVPFISCGIIGGLTFRRMGSTSPRRCLWRPLLLMLAIFEISEVIIFAVSDIRDVVLSAYDVRMMFIFLWMYLNGAIGASFLTAFALRVHELSVDAFSPPTIP